MNRLLLFILIFISFTTTAYAFVEDCPTKWDVHCAYINQAIPNGGRWVKAVMSPRNVTMVVCMNEHTTLELESDDLKEDQVKPGTQLTWQFSQCMDESCQESQPLGVDQFMVYANKDGYYAVPDRYGFVLREDYGKICN